MNDDFEDVFGEDFDPQENFSALLPENGEEAAVEFACAACGEPNTVHVDPAGGLRQQYTEDCAVCCRPNLLTITVDYTTRRIAIVNELEYE